MARYLFLAAEVTSLVGYNQAIFCTIEQGNNYLAQNNNIIILSFNKLSVYGNIHLKLYLTVICANVKDSVYNN